MDHGLTYMWLARGTDTYVQIKIDPTTISHCCAYHTYSHMVKSCLPIRRTLQQTLILLLEPLILHDGNNLRIRRSKTIK